MSDDLKPCPFCAGAFLYHSRNGRESHFMSCGGCGAEGPAMPTEMEATAAWSRRAAAQPPAAMPAPLSRQQIDNIMTQHYPLDSLLRENVDAFEACVRDIEAAISAQPVPATGAQPDVRMEPTAFSIAKAQIVSRHQLDGSKLWAVVGESGEVLNKHGEWEWEPQTSSRLAEFMARCRFASPLEARDAYMRHLAAAHTGSAAE